MDDQIRKEHNKNFTDWFKNLMNDNPLLPESNENAHLIYALSQGPAYNLATYQAFDINGYTFYTEEKDKTSNVYQNSGVTMESLTGDEKRRYYGRIEEIWELDYSGEATVAMFRVRWAKNVDTKAGYFTTMTIPEAQPVGAPST